MRALRILSKSAGLFSFLSSFPLTKMVSYSGVTSSAALHSGLPSSSTFS